MPFELRRFASGDTDYISKLNADNSLLENTINVLQQAAEAGGALSPASMAALIGSLFNNTITLIGPNSYTPTIIGTTLSIAPGGAYLPIAAATVQSLGTVVLIFAGQPAGTYYVVLDSAGLPSRTLATDGNSIYSVVWSGSALSAVTLLVPVLFDGAEATAARNSAARATVYPTLDARLEASEVQAIAALADAATALTAATDAAAMAYDALSAVGGARVRKVGLSLDGGGLPISTGVKGSIQVDFAGAIIGWNIVADQVGSITVEVDKIASSDPPATPGIPNTTTDKISASAPITLTAAQSKAVAAAGVSTWTTAVDQWDVIQFNVTAVTTITRATLYIRIQE